MKKGAYILFILTNLLVLNSFAQATIDSTNIDSLLLAKKEAYYPKTFTLEDSVFEVGSVLLEDIKFGYNYSGILKESFPFLDSLSNFIKHNKKLQLEISHYTDYRGKEAYNNKLSKRRANCIKETLVAEGVSELILISFGKGESELIISKEETLALPTKRLQEKAHALNRRTEFKITKKVFNKTTPNTSNIIH